MIQQIKDIGFYGKFIENFRIDSRYSDPHFTYDNENLFHALDEDLQMALVVSERGQTTGLFVIKVMKDEKYAEMLIGLSRNADAYREFISFMKERYSGYHVDFVLNPKNNLFCEELRKNHAIFETEQINMVFRGMKSFDSAQHVVRYRSEYREQYVKIHRNGNYWTAEKVLYASDRFRIYLALENDSVVGYLDVTYRCKENEPYDLYVEEQYRRKGYDKELLSAALKDNLPNGMMVLIDVDALEEIQSYVSAGFVRVENENSLTVGLDA